MKQEKNVMKHEKDKMTKTHMSSLILQFSSYFIVFILI